MRSTDACQRFVCSMMANAALFGAGAVLVLSIPALADQTKMLLPLAVIAAFVAAPSFALAIAPRMRFLDWKRRDWKRGDVISG